MTQNRNKLLALFIGNLSNAVLHKILGDAIDNNEIANKYKKELTTSFAIAMKYREKIHPILMPLPELDQAYIKEKITRRVQGELMLRIAKGYENINIELIETITKHFLKEANVKE